MVPQLVYTIFEIVGLLSVPFLLAGGYNTNYAKLRRGYYSSMTEEIAHKWSVISFIAYVAASKFNAKKLFGYYQNLLLSMEIADPYLDGLHLVEEYLLIF